MIVVLGFNNCNREIGLIEEQVIGAFLLSAGHQFATHNDATIGKGIFSAPPALIPSGLKESWRNETVTNV